MTIYTCNSCGYHTDLKSNFNRHMTSKKHLKNAQMLGNVRKKLGNVRNSSKNVRISSKTNKSSNTDEILKIEDSTNNEISSKSTHPLKKKYSCPYCNKSYTHRSTLSSHINKKCHINEEKQMQKLADMLNAVQQQNENDIQELTSHFQNEIAKLTKQLQLQQVGPHQSHNKISGSFNNTVNFQLLNYNKTDYDFLTDNDYIHCIKNNNHCVKALIEKVHFNKNKPENMNIYISSIKGKFAMIFRDNSWQICDRQKQIDDLYETNEMELEQWFDECNENYPDIIKSFKNYLRNKSSDDSLIQNVKHEIELMLYNKRGMIPEID